MSPAVSTIVSVAHASSGRMTFLRAENDSECGQGWYSRLRVPSLTYPGSGMRGTHCQSYAPPFCWDMDDNLDLATELTMLDFPEGSLFPSVRVCCVPCGEAELRQINGRARPAGLRRWPGGWGEAEEATSWPETCTLLGSLRARSEYWAASWHARQLLQGLVHLFKEGKQNRAAR